MDCRAALLWGLAVLILIVAMAEGRSKKVVIHVPFKLKKIKHTHTVYKTIHHHHGIRDHHDHHDLGSTMIHETHHLPPTAEDHEHFHHMHLRDEPQAGQHTQPIPGIGIPEFLPDVPMDPDDMAHDMSVGRRVPMFRRAGPDDE